MTGHSTRLRLDPDEDFRLVERCRTGDARAWEALVRRYERLVYAVARSYRLSDADLGDVFQEVFAALHRGLPRLRDARSLCRWLSSTTERIARATVRRARLEPSVRLDDPDSRAEPPATDPPIGTDLELLEEQALIRLALASLPERCRLLLEALYYEDPPPHYRVLSRRLGMPIGSLGPTRARCFETLRRAYARVVDPETGINRQPSPTYPDDAPRPPGNRIRAGVGGAGVAREDAR